MKNEEKDLFTIRGRYTKGKLAYSYPSWMMFGMVGVADPSTHPQPVAELYEIYNPKGEQYVEGVEYIARVIPFDDGDIVEIIEQIPDTK